MTKKLRLILLATLAFGMSHAVMAGDAAAGKGKASKCAACHGETGISPNDIWPNLAGQKEGYLIKHIKAFRDGDRKDPMMSPMAAGLSDEDINDLAAWYSSQQ